MILKDMMDNILVDVLIINKNIFNLIINIKIIK